MTYEKAGNLTHDHTAHANFTAEDLKVHWAYIIISIFNASVLVFFIIVYCFRPVTKEHPSGSLSSNESTPQKEKKLEKKEEAYVITDKSVEKSIEAHQSIEKSNKLNEQPPKYDPYTLIKPLNPYLKVVVTVLSILFFHSYCGLEISFGSILPTFAVKSNIHMTKSEAAYLTSSYWGMVSNLCFDCDWS